jgi:outer membrane protein assembly factor BamA
MSCRHLSHQTPFSGRRLSSFVIAVVLSLLLAGDPSRAQGPVAGTSRLDAIGVSGSTRFTSEQIAAATGLRAGTNVTREELQAAADRLAKLGPFASVQYRFSTAESGVKVDYQVTDAPLVPVSFDNFPWFADEELNSAIKGSVVLFDGMAPTRGAILEEMTMALSKFLETRGIHARASHTLITPPARGQRTLEFRVDGAELNVASVEFSDPLANQDRAIQQRRSDIVGKPFSRSAFELFEFEQVRPVYLSHAFLRVQFGRPSPRIAGNAKNSAPNQVAVLLPVDPGPSYIWRGVRWGGNSTLAESDLDKLVELRPGDPANGLKIEATWEVVRHAYGQRGYLDVNADPVPQFDENAKCVSYTVSITEGTQYHMGSLVLTGLSLDGERRIRAGWKIAPGEVFDESAYDQFLDSGIKQAFAGLSVHYDRIGRFLQRDPKTGKVDVLIDFQ